MHIIKDGDWFFETKQVRAIKTKEYGEQYIAKADFNIVDGKLHVEGLISKEEFTRKDYETLERHVKRLGFTEYKLSRFNKHGERRTVKRLVR